MIRFQSHGWVVHVSARLWLGGRYVHSTITVPVVDVLRCVRTKQFSELVSPSKLPPMGGHAMVLAIKQWVRDDRPEHVSYVPGDWE